MNRILVIEDEIELLETIAEWLHFESFTVYQATNGREGLELAVKELPDLIISDVMMPELDGHRVLMEVRARGETAVIPFIFLTALADRHDLRHGMDLGADDYVTKPFTRDELLRAVRSRLARQAIHQRQSEIALNELRTSVMRALPHELRTPLTAILGSGELLTSSPDWFTHTELEEMGRLIVLSGERLLHLIENYLFFLEVEAREKKPITPDKAANASLILEDAGTYLAEKYGRLADLHISAEEATLNVSSRDWRKIVSEVLDNAFKFSPADTQITVIGHRIDRHYTLSVCDLGRGMKSEDIRKIGPYMQFDRKQHEQQGSGLGLAIVKRALEFCGGTFAIDSTVTLGTTILLTIPLALPVGQ